jgi:hypothetical protein
MDEPPTIYRVTANEGRWTVKRDGEPSMGTFDTRMDAMRLARGLASAGRPSCIRVHRADGSIEEEVEFAEEQRA